MVGRDNFAAGRAGVVDRAPRRCWLFVGQAEARRLRCYSSASSAARRGTRCPGPTGLGKDVGAVHVARAWGLVFGDLWAWAGQAGLRDLDISRPAIVLFIDEFTAEPAVGKSVYPALEDFELDLVIRRKGAGAAVRSIEPYVVGAGQAHGLWTRQ